MTMTFKDPCSQVQDVGGAEKSLLHSPPFENTDNYAEMHFLPVDIFTVEKLAKAHESKAWGIRVAMWILSQKIPQKR